MDSFRDDLVTVTTVRKRAKTPKRKRRRASRTLKLVSPGQIVASARRRKADPIEPQVIEPSIGGEPTVNPSEPTDMMDELTQLGDFEPNQDMFDPDTDLGLEDDNPVPEFTSPNPDDYPGMPGLGDPDQESAGVAVNNFQSASRRRAVGPGVPSQSAAFTPQVSNGGGKPKPRGNPVKDGPTPDDISERQAMIRMAGDNLEAIGKGLSGRVQKLADQLQAAHKYAGDPRSYIAGGPKEDWKKKLTSDIDALDRSLKAVKATADLALSNL